MITVPFQILTQGYSIEGERGGSPKAIVPFLVSWQNSFTFYNEVLGFPSATVFGPIAFNSAFPFPPSPRMYAVRARIEPIGAGAAAGTNMGLSPGEFFTLAKITVEFESPPYIQSPSDDPGGLNQLDPSNPLTLCEQSISMSGRMVTVKAGGLEFDDGTAVVGDVGMVVPEVRIVLTFPRVPYLPFELVKTYLGDVNDRVVLGCAKGTLLFEGSDTKITATTQGFIGQSVTLNFAWQQSDWNQGLKSDGSTALMRKKSDHSTRIYEYKNLANLFLTYNPE